MGGGNNRRYASVKETAAAVSPPLKPCDASEQGVESCGVVFHPPSRKYWRIGGKFYDLKPFLDRHPGGRKILLLARDRFEDCTFAFEAHHHNYQRVRTVLAKYEVDASVLSSDVNSTLSTSKDKPPTRLLDDDAFYSVFRRRVAEYFRSINSNGGPTFECKLYFWLSFIVWLSTLSLTAITGSFGCAIGLGVTAAILGAFGHNWAHQPGYELWAFLSLDTIGFSSAQWFRAHNLQHHMYTNTPFDNHFKGTDPFLVADPTVERSWIQKYIMPYINPLVLSFGLIGNYVIYWVEVGRGTETWNAWRLCLPFQIALMIYRWGWYWGFCLSYTWLATCSIWYFSIALMNHNAAHTLNVDERNRSRDWGVAQLNSSADWGVGLKFWQAVIFLWLNYHTVHHLAPRVDFCHHPQIQAILLQTCSEFGVIYDIGSPLKIYLEMVRSFASPRSLYRHINIYSGAT